MAFPYEAVIVDMEEVPVPEIVERVQLHHLTDQQELQDQNRKLEQEDIIFHDIDSNAFQEGEREDEDSPNLIHSAESESICLVCGNLVELDFRSFSPPQQVSSHRLDSVISSPEQSLHLLLYAFNIAPSIYKGQGMDVNSLPLTLYCSPCKLKVFETIKIMNDIETLESKLKSLKKEIKRTLVTSFDHEHSENFLPYSYENHSTPNQSVRRLRKTFAQCWSSCQVDVMAMAGVNVNLKCSSTTPNKQSEKIFKKPVIAQGTIIKEEKVLCQLPPRPRRQIKKPMKYENFLIRVKSERNFVENENPSSIVMPESPANESDDQNDSPYFPPEIQIDNDSDSDPDFTCDVPQKKPRTEVQGNTVSDDDQDEDSEQDKSPTKNNDKNRARIGRPKGRKPYCSILKIRKAHKGTDLPFKCSICPKGYRYQKHLQLHENYHKGLLDFPCNKCSRKFASSFHLKLHKIYIHKHPTIKSRMPNKIQNDADNPDHNHVKKTTKTSKTPGVTRRTKNYCQRFVSQQQFTCTHCSKDFLKSSFLLPNGKYRFTCDIFGCGHSFSNFLIFTRHHIRTCLANKGKECFTCQFCSKECYSQKTLDSHLVSFHTKNYQFYCEKCGVGLVNKGSYKRHIQQHSEEKKFKCTFCPTAYKRKDYLVTHLKRHTNVEALPYTCDKCGKGFTDSAKLNRHKTVHNEVNQFPCPICNKLFKSKNYVNSHVWSTHKMGSQRKNRNSKGVKRVRRGKQQKTEYEQVEPENQYQGHDQGQSHSSDNREEDGSTDEIERQVKILKAEEQYKRQQW